MPSAYLLISHGSRDPRPQVAMDHLAQLLRQKVEIQSEGPIRIIDACEQEQRSPTPSQLTAQPVDKPLVGTACLELRPEPLHQQIEQFSVLALAAGYDRIQVLPIFLLPGVHVSEDIPAEVAKAQSTEQLTVDLRPYLGTHLGLSRLLANTAQETHESPPSWILLAHGSSRAGAKEPVEAMAATLGAVPAYWAVSPKLEARVAELVAAGQRRIGILPYFLFSGGITDAIARSVKQLKLNFPSVIFQLAEPLGVSEQLVDLIWDLVEK